MDRKHHFLFYRFHFVPEGVTMSFKKHKVLLIDDNLDTLDLVEVYLFRYFDVYTAANGFEGLKLARDLQPAIIITDIMMPVVDGIRLFNDLRKQEKTAAVPVVAITSFLKKITKKSLLNMGFNGVISKPINRGRLLSLIAKLLNMPAFSNDTNVANDRDIVNGQQVSDETTS
jgi:CheY-like chemotaxis protein